MKGKIKQVNMKWIISILLCAAVLGLTGVTFAWIRNLQQLNTVALVQIPSRITLSGANRSELQRISLELTADDVKTAEGVTIRRVFCVESTADYWLEVVRTTNIENMEIKIYPVSNSNSNQEAGTVKGTDGVQTFYYTPDGACLAGDYINLVKNGTIAIQKGNQGTLHAENYDTDDVVQQNAEPLYWRTSQIEECDRADYSASGKTEEDEIDIYYRYYVLELSWKTLAQETDMVYLMASH